ncbi:MAG: phosphoglycerate kinase [marine benthic group bacterium]|jgi:phosphoglycerate kinase|nr:phosphoglycerate kinase [Candidatus Benthicola marisminoris]
MRVDYNVPLEPDGSVSDTARIEATLPTLRAILDRGGRPVLLSHLGRPKGKVVPSMSLAPVAPILADRLGAVVRFVPSTDTDEALAASEDLSPGEVLLLENTRFLPGETGNDPDLAARLARLGDLFVNDAFGSTHRAHASVVGVADHLRPAVAGLLVAKEIDALSGIREGCESPFVVILGGAKIGDKIGLLETFLRLADVVLIGGAMANTFLRARGLDTGRSLVEADAVEIAGRFLESGGDRLRLPSDLVVADPAAADASSARIVDAADIPPDLAALDIGPATREAFASIVREARTVFWNGPMGLFEKSGFDDGTVSVARAVAECTAAGGFTVIGGGDSAAAVRQAGLADSVSHVSTGGGASLEYLAHGALPGLEALDPA